MWLRGCTRAYKPECASNPAEAQGKETRKPGKHALNSHWFFLSFSSSPKLSHLRPGWPTRKPAHTHTIHMPSIYQAIPSQPNLVLLTLTST